MSQVKQHCLTFPDNRSPACTHAAGSRPATQDVLESQKRLEVAVGMVDVGKAPSRCLQHCVWVLLLCDSMQAQSSASLDGKWEWRWNKLVFAFSVLSQLL